VKAIWSRLSALIHRWRKPASWDRALTDELRQEVRHACRALVQSRGYAAWVVGSLAVGMAVAIAALAFLNTLLFRPFPAVVDQARLVRVAVSGNCGRPDCSTRMSSDADYAALRQGLTGLQGLAAYAAGDIAAGLPQARSMHAVLISSNYFDVLGVRAANGRMFGAADEETRAPVAVIAHRVWTREFASDPSAVGRTIRVADRFVHIVGVAPPSFVGIDLKPARGDPGPDIWLPLWLADRVLPLTRAEQRRRERDVSFVGRMRDGISLTELRAEADVVGQRLAASRWPAALVRAIADVRPVLMGNPEHRSLAAGLILPIPILVLVIACVNAANLMLARGSQRRREIAIRLAIGAARGRIVGQLLVESGILALLAAGVAVPIAWSGLRLADSPLSIPIPIDSTVLARTVLTALITTIGFGLLPAMRIAGQHPSTALGPAGPRSDAAPRPSRMRRLLVLAQVALSIGLLATAWQLVATVRMQAVSGGTRPDRLLMARFDLQPLGLQPGEIDTFYRDLAAAASRLPDVHATGLARHASVWTFGQGTASGSIVVWGPGDAPEHGRVTIGGYAGGDLFDAVGLRTLAGRGFADADRQGRPRVAVVNQTFAQRVGGLAVGSAIRVAPRGQDFGSAVEVRVIGIIEPALEPRLDPEGPPAAKVYLPSPIEPEPALALYVRTRDRAAMLAQPVREIVSRLAPRVPVLDIGSLDDLNTRTFGPQLWLARAAAFLGVIGLLLATAGLYGVSSYVVATRSREIAIRMAVGARPREILAMILGQSMLVAAAGLLVGGAAAVGVSRVIQSEYHGIVGIEITAFGGAAALFLLVMLVASAIPAVRASRVDPVAHLKDA
jgi:putative ABC transport system permease protein